MPVSGHSTEERFVITAEARRRWSREEKLAIVGQIAESTVSAVARRHNIAPSLLFRWKRELGGTAGARLEAPEFVRIALPAPIVRGAGSPSVVNDDGAMEIVLNGGHRVIVGKHADMTALRQVVAILEGR
jgi:transposase